MDLGSPEPAVGVAIRYPFPLGPYGRVQAFFNVVHAALLGYAAVTYTGLVVLLTYVLIRPRGLRGRLELLQPPMRAAGQHEVGGDTGQIPGDNRRCPTDGRKGC